MQLALKQQDYYTYADYLTWDDNERWEIINGVAYNMSPAPTTRHQLISWELSRQIGNYLHDFNKTCFAFYAPFDVRFPQDAQDDEIIDVVQPDVSVICDVSKLDEKGCHGAPDLIIEILSPSTSKKDLVDKRILYENNRVQEYWLIDPTHNVATVYRLEAFGKYGSPMIHANKGKLEVQCLPGLTIDLDLVLRNPLAQLDATPCVRTK
jgi:Uma2 family endonuclease